VLTLVASTPAENAMLDIVLQNGYLSTVKLWMDDILKGSLGEFSWDCNNLWIVCHTRFSRHLSY
jgi:hypothetical protein